MFGYDWPRLHAALNDLPAALLVASVLFDWVGALTHRESLRAAGLWTLVTGVLGAGAAILTGELAEDAIVEHSDQAHAVMETHETLAIIVTVLFGLLAVWRIMRRGVLNDRERPVAITAGVIGVALLTITGKIGGNLVFDHALGVPARTLHTIIDQRGAAHEHEEGENDEHPAADSVAAADSAAGATHRDAAPHTHPADTTAP